ncbi:MAG: dihydrofolate reductase [Polyangiaceae bacterium]
MIVLEREPLTLIAAVAKNKVIGYKNGLPWRVPEDLKFFKAQTTGHAIVMGKKTFDSTGKPLPNRRNIVVSRSATAIEGAEIARSIEEAVARARETDADPFVIGGAEIYRAALPLATRMLLTEIDQEPEGDTFFPDFPRDEWREVLRKSGEGQGVTFTTWERFAG